MDFLTNISRAECAFLDNLPQEVKDKLTADIIAAQERHRGLLDIHQLSAILGLSRDGVDALPVKFVTPFRRTSRGHRQVRSVHRDSLLSYLVSLNPAYADFDPKTETLLKPAEAAELLLENGGQICARELRDMRRAGKGPQCVQLSPRVTRYRLRDVLSWIQSPTENPLAASELIMGDCS